MPGLRGESVLVGSCDTGGGSLAARAANRGDSYNNITITINNDKIKEKP